MIESDLERPSHPIELRHASTNRTLLVVVPERRFLAIHGAGPRSADDFRFATVVLRSVSEIVRALLGSDLYGVRARPILEITWPIDGRLSIDEIEEALADDRHRWRQMIELPHRATNADAALAIDRACRMAGRDIPLVQLIRLTEGRAAQVLRVGSEPVHACTRKLLRLVLESGYRPSGDLHELVLADPAAVGVDRARSILRVPVGVGRNAV